jgi:hypothetical protein
VNARETTLVGGTVRRLTVNERQIGAVAYDNRSAGAASLVLHVFSAAGVNGKPPDVVSFDSGQQPS